MARLIELSKRIAAEFKEDLGSRMAGSIAYRTIFALAPLLLIAVSIAGFVYEGEEARNRLVTQLEPVAGSEVTDLVAGIVDQAQTSRGISGVIGFLLLAWTSSALLLEVQSALNVVFGMRDKVAGGVGGFIRQRLSAMTAALVVGALLVGSMMVNSLVGVIESQFDMTGGAAAALRIASPVASLALLGGVFVLLFRYLPSDRIPWRAARIGGLATAVAFVVGSLAVSLFFDPARFSSTGFAGGFVLILFMVYVLAQIFLLGAEITKVLLLSGDAPTGVEPERPTEAPVDRVAGGVGAFVAGIAVGAALLLRGRRR